MLSIPAFGRREHCFLSVCCYRILKMLCAKSVCTVKYDYVSFGFWVLFLFDLILYVPVNNFSVILGRVSLG